MSSRIVGLALGVIAIPVMAGGIARGEQPSARPQEQAIPVEQPAAPSERPMVEVHTTINRTAVWVGDPILWTVELVCAPMVDVIADDLAGETLNLQGLELVASDTERTTGEDGALVHRVTYQFRTYEIGLPALRVAPFAVRYFVRRPGQRAEDLEPAGQVDVPGVLLAWRSTIPSGLTTVDLRHERAAESIPTLLAVARPIGLTLVVVSFAPVAVWGVSRLRKVRLPRARRQGARASRREARASLQQLLTADTSTEAARRDAYAQLGAVLRRLVAATSSAPARARTFGKIATWVGGTASNPAGEAIAEALEQCERACYGPTERVPSAEQFRDSVALLERVV